MAHGIKLPQAMCNRCSYKFILLDPRATADCCGMQYEAKKVIILQGILLGSVGFEFPQERPASTCCRT